MRLLQVLRWGALVTGVFYGFTHQSAIRSSDKKAAAHHDWERRVKLIDDAKAEYAKKNAPPGQGDGGEFYTLYSEGFGGRKGWQYFRLSAVNRWTMKWGARRVWY
jgi:F-type H+-transporting ATP synthase subunit e